MKYLAVVPIALAGFLFVATPFTASARTWVVTPNGSGDTPTIQAAIDSCLDGDVVELAGGLIAGDGNRDINFSGKAITVHSASDDPE